MILYFTFHTVIAINYISDIRLYKSIVLDGKKSSITYHHHPVVILVSLLLILQSLN